MKVLVTGASGFIGSFIVEAAVGKGYETYAGIRKTSSKRFLSKAGINFLELDFADAHTLEQNLLDFKKKQGAFDYVIHCAGVTKCLNTTEFIEVNYKQTALFADTLIKLGMVPKQFIYISTLSVYGPIHEDNYEPITESDKKVPNTAYGLSKLKS